MMTSLGHEVFLYGGTQNEADVKEHITVVSDEDIQKWFGEYDWDTRVFDQWDPEAPCWKEMNAKASLEIGARRIPGDILGIIAGRCQEQLTRDLPDMRAVEWGIGYEGILDNTFHVFESNPWMHYVYGQKGIKNGRFFDTVIPNSFDNDDYTFNDLKDDYLLYLGRLTPRKGLAVIEELAKKGHTIVTAGQGDIRIPGVEHVGVVRGKQKAELLAGAKALLCPTLYIEPFGGVAIEAMLSGTPVITTDFGAFTETVTDGVHGYRCHTMSEFEAAAIMVERLSSKTIRKHAEGFLTKCIRHDYEAYFQRLQLLDGKGWYS